jgi:hypothetical protein
MLDFAAGIHQHQLHQFFKPRLIPARARFKEITNSAKLVILLIIPTYAKVSLSIIFFL